MHQSCSIASNKRQTSTANMTEVHSQLLQPACMQAAACHMTPRERGSTAAGLTAWLHQQVYVAVVLAAAQQPDDVLVLPRLLDGELLPHMLLLLLLQLRLMGLRDDLQQAGEAMVNLKMTSACRNLLAVDGASRCLQATF
jgi:hypothetical protein